MNSILSLLLDPNPDDALESSVAAEYKHERLRFIENAKNATEKYGNLTN